MKAAAAAGDGVIAPENDETLEDYVELNEDGQGINEDALALARKASMTKVSELEGQESDDDVSNDSHDDDYGDDFGMADETDAEADEGTAGLDELKKVASSFE